MQVNFASLVQKFRKAESAQLDAANLMREAGNGLAMAFPLGMKYDDYAEAARKWKDARIEDVKCSPEAAQAAFERAIARMNDVLKEQGAETFVIPKSDSSKAVKSAAKREAEKKEAQSRLGQIGILPDSNSAEASVALAKAKKIDDETRAAALAFIATKAKEETKAKAKKADDERKALAKKVHEYLKNAPYEKVVEEAKRLGLVK